MDEQPRLTDLVPLRLSLYLIPLAAGLAIIAGLEFLYAWSSRLSSLTTDGCIAAFDLDTEGSLGTWFSSTILLLAGLVAVLVYLVRRHRTDDYQGYYRVWLWTAFCCFLMSVDEGSSLHEGFKELMAHLTGTRLLGDGSLWWVIPYFFLLGAVGTRLLVDMRPCRLSTATLMGAAAAFGLAVVAQLGWILPESGARGVMLEEGAEMVGDLLLLLAMALHARHVILEAKGLLPERKPKADETEEDPTPQAATLTADEQQEEQEDNEPEETEEAEPEDAESEEWEGDEQEEDEEASDTSSITVHPPHGVPRPASSPSHAVPKPASPAVAPAALPRSRKAAARARKKAVEATKPVVAPAEPQEPSHQAQRKLTKAERKAMRKRLAELRSAREERLNQ